jgi:hypothetical protein
MAVLGLFLLLNVVLPQRAVLGEEAFARLAERGAARLALVTLGLGSIPTNPAFLGTLGLFFLSLGASLLDRFRPMLRRSRERKPTPEAAAAWVARPGALQAPVPPGWTARNAAEVLRACGYRTAGIADGRLWAVRNAAAPLGFALFHASFFVLCLGGLLLWGTRFAGTATAIEGQPWQGTYGRIVREPPWGARPKLAFTVSDVESRVERGQPVHLGATVRFLHAGRGVEQKARVNEPARWGSSTVLLQTAGLALQLWLQDGEGYTLERVLAPAVKTAGEPSVVSLAEGRWEVVAPALEREAFPSREALPETAVRLQVRPSTGGEAAFDGALRPGDSIRLGADRLVLEDLRPWVGVLVVSERGGALLVAGFLLGVVGLTWRMIWYRREVLVAWGDGTLTLAGRSEHFPLRFRQELEALLELLLAEGGTNQAGGRTGPELETTRANNE